MNYPRASIPDGVILFEPPAMDVALIGWAEDDFGRNRAVYSYTGIFSYYVDEFDGDAEGAEEFIDFNVLGLRLSEGAPIIVFD